MAAIDDFLAAVKVYNDERLKLSDMQSAKRAAQSKLQDLQVAIPNQQAVVDQALQVVKDTYAKAIT